MPHRETVAKSPLAAFGFLLRLWLARGSRPPRRFVSNRAPKASTTSACIIAFGKLFGSRFIGHLSTLKIRPEWRKGQAAKRRRDWRSVLHRCGNFTSMPSRQPAIPASRRPAPPPPRNPGPPESRPPADPVKFRNSRRPGPLPFQLLFPQLGALTQSGGRLTKIALDRQQCSPHLLQPPTPSGNTQPARSGHGNR